jgi:RecA/RadA recombinase
MGSRQKDYVMVTAVEDWEQAYQIQQMLQDHEIPATIKEHQGLGDQPSWAVMVPEEYLDEAPTKTHISGMRKTNRSTALRTCSINRQCE